MFTPDLRFKYSFSLGVFFIFQPYDVSHADFDQDEIFPSYTFTQGFIKDALTVSAERFAKLVWRRL
jgi:hypothetical protein